MNIQTVTHNGLTFVDVHNPLELEIKHLKTIYNFNPLHLEDYQSRNQNPSIDQFKDYILAVMDFPHLEGLPLKIEKEETKTLLQRLPLPSAEAVKKMLVRTGHVNFFIGNDYLVVIHDDKTSEIDHIFSECQKTLRNRHEFMNEGPQFLFYRIVDALADSSFLAINHISAAIDSIDKKIADENSPIITEDISVMRRNVVVFKSMIKQVIPIISELEKGSLTNLKNNLSPFWNNVLSHLEKISVRLDISRELLEGISVSNESIQTFKNNELVKFLTIITSFSFPFVIVNNLYSMNVKGLPFADRPWIVIVLFEVILAGAVSVFLYFKYRKWI